MTDDSTKNECPLVAGPCNTKTGPAPRDAPRYNWCFTINNYDEFDIADLLSHLGSIGSTKYVFQEEIGEKEGTPHLQGCFNCRPKKRFKTLKKILGNKIHLEVMRKPFAASIRYCTKSKSKKEDGRRWSQGLNLDEEPLKLIEEFRPWQKEILDLVSVEPDDRSILWLWETKGGVGKSVFAKYLCAELDAVICAGKAADMKHTLSSLKEKRGISPKIIIFDVPRTSLQYLSYTGIEEIKNGCFNSSKYESAMVIMNCPHVLVFANKPPDWEKVSLDRWCCFKIEDSKLIKQDPPDLNKEQYFEE